MGNENYILNEVGKGLQMGMDSISNITEKVEDKNLKNTLLCQYDEYGSLLARVNEELKKYTDTPKEVSPMQKTMEKIGIEMNTLMDKSNSKIAEIMLQGTNMGIIEGVKLLNHNPDATKEVKSILNDFISFQEHTVEKLKEYL